MSAVFPVPSPPAIPGVTPAARQFLRCLYGALTWLSPELAARAALQLFTTPWRGRIDPRARPLFSLAEITQLRHRDFRLQVYVWNGAGPTILLAHGWSSRASRLRFLIENLRIAGFRVIAFDAPGHGASSRARSSVSLFVEALHAVIEWAGTVQAVLGHSLGARAATLLLQSARLPQIRALGVIAAPPDVRYMLEEFKVVLGLHPAVCTLLDEQVARASGVLEMHSAEEPTQLHLPVLVVHDRNDDVAPFEHASRLAIRLRRGRLLATRALNHCGVLEDPATIASLIEFLAEQCEGGPLRVAVSDTRCNEALLHRHEGNP